MLKSYEVAIEGDRITQIKQKGERVYAIALTLKFQNAKII
jgi:hypothetical protein